MENLKTGKIDLNYVKSNFDARFGTFENRVKLGIDEKKSVCLYLNNKIIGFYLLNKHSILQYIKVIKRWNIINKKQEMPAYILHDLEFFTDHNFLKQYTGKIGICSDYLFIDKQYRKRGYGQFLIEYSKTIGDYVWGISVKGISDDFWFKKQNRIKICEYTVKNGYVGIASITNL